VSVYQPNVQFGFQRLDRMTDSRLRETEILGGERKTARLR
jgi:hypothetical protein